MWLSGYGNLWVNAYMVDSTYPCNISDPPPSGGLGGETTLNTASQKVEINSVYINCTTNGRHINNPPTHVRNHYRGLAIDLSRINGIPVAVQPKSDLFKYIQIALDQYPNIRENFEPYFKHKFGVPFNTNDGTDHIHFSVNP